MGRVGRLCLCLRCTCASRSVARLIACALASQPLFVASLRRGRSECTARACSIPTLLAARTDPLLKIRELLPTVDLEDGLRLVPELKIRRIVKLKLELAVSRACPEKNDGRVEIPKVFRAPNEKASFAT